MKIYETKIVYLIDDLINEAENYREKGKDEVALAYLKSAMKLRSLLIKCLGGSNV